MERMFKVLTTSGLVILLCFSMTGVVFAQNEDSFVRTATVSKRDATMLSVLFPGLGQMTAGSKIKGVSMFLSETVSLALFVNSHENYTTKLDTYNRDKAILDGMAQNPGGNYAEASKLFSKVKSQSSKLDDLNKTRNIALILSAGIYAYNLFDAIFLTSPSTESQKAELHQNIAVESVMIDKAPGILISKRF